MAARCRRGGVPVHVVVVGNNTLERVRELDLASVREATNLEELEAAGRELGRALVAR